jgi:hypothetical protein
MTDNHPEAGHAASELGADDLEHDDNLPEGGAVALLFVAAAAVIAALLGVHLLAAFIAP